MKLFKFFIFFLSLVLLLSSCFTNFNVYARSNNIKQPVKLSSNQNIQELIKLSDIENTVDYTTFYVFNNNTASEVRDGLKTLNLIPDNMYNKPLKKEVTLFDTYLLLSYNAKDYDDNFDYTTKCDTTKIPNEYKNAIAFLVYKGFLTNDILNIEDRRISSSDFVKIFVLANGFDTKYDTTSLLTFATNRGFETIKSDNFTMGQMYCTFFNYLDFTDNKNIKVYEKLISNNKFKKDSLYTVTKEIYKKDIKTTSKTYNELLLQTNKLYMLDNGDFDLPCSIKPKTTLDSYFTTFLNDVYITNNPYKAISNNLYYTKGDKIVALSFNVSNSLAFEVSSILKNKDVNVSSDAKATAPIIKDFLINNIKNTDKNYDKVLKTHNYIIEKTSYDESALLLPTVPKSARTAYGNLTTNKSVCEGYVAIFKTLLDIQGIENYSVVGKQNGVSSDTFHTWNKVRIDNNYYNIDVTWDDPIIKDKNNNTLPTEKLDKKINYTYFCLSDEEFLKTHTWNDEHLPKAIESLKK